MLATEAVCSSSRIARWRPFGLEALDYNNPGDRKFQTKSWEQAEELLPPANSCGRMDDTISSISESFDNIPISMRKLIADVTKCLDLIYSDNADVISKTIRMFSEQTSGGPTNTSAAYEDNRNHRFPHARRDHDDCTVRVSNLADSVTEADLIKLFNRIGDVTRASLVCSHETRLSRGFAFVSFRSSRDCARAVEQLKGKGLAGCVLMVELAVRRD